MRTTTKPLPRSIDTSTSTRRQNEKWTRAPEPRSHAHTTHSNATMRHCRGAKNFDSAVAPLEKLAKANTDNGQAWLYYGIALSRSGQMRKAMEALEITIQLIPDSIPALSELGYVYESDKQYQQALRIYEKAYAASNDPAIKAIVDRVRALDRLLL